ncbi:MAG: 3-hydroxyacyl-ACP dehydratase FabZ [candidate division WOR-3 bacterium]|nr:3-hydroxyacyl-ACP dehydratase FabZ [candidate division WOR-3 bacterium]MCX7836630.1 3-hydroxyacyl-ACP dehydratase FabZ [candidate division WOR-3 bacterium]MDW8113322.1 3-hydroxyacyl-ACP dehydratase FabZ [candidate division WOR-3 bacterium]
MDIEKIREILPHRYPFLFIDKILNIEESKIIALKQVTYNEWFFIGHFPDFPIMPGVLMVEAMAQASGILICKNLEMNEKDLIPLFLGIEKIRFRKAVKPGDTLIIEAELKNKMGNIFKVSGKIEVNKQVVCEGDLLLGFEKKEKIL